MATFKFKFDVYMNILIVSVQRDRHIAEIRS